MCFCWSIAVLMGRQMENTTINTTTTGNPLFLWVAPSKQWDTIGILYFCFTTGMIICVWSTVHFNIPITCHSPVHHFLLHVLCMLAALIALEALFYCTTNEQIDASALVRGAMEYLLSQQLSKPGKLVCAFTANRVCIAHTVLLLKAWLLVKSWARMGQPQDVGHACKTQGLVQKNWGRWRCLLL